MSQSIRQQIAQRRATIRKSEAVDPFDNVSVEANNNEIGELAMKKLLEVGKSTGKLVLSNRGLEDLPQSLYTSFDVGKRNISVDLSGNNDTTNWWEQKELTKLFLNDNRLSIIPEELVIKFNDLCLIDLMNNRIQTLPNYIEGFQCLNYLNLSHNMISEVPLELFKLPLIDLNLSHNQLSEFNIHIINGGLIDSIVTLTLNNNQINYVSEGINTFKNLKNLNLSWNKLTNLPNNFNYSTNLSDLDLSHNQLTQLSFLNNEIEANFPNLKVLNASYNRLFNINPAINSNFQLLEQLILNYNSLKTINQFLLLTPNLNSLVLGNNLMEQIPDDLLKLKKISQLDLSNNCLNRIPPQIGNLDTLNHILLDGNNLRGIPKLSLGTKEFLYQLKQRIPREESIEDLNNNIGNNINDISSDIVNNEVQPTKMPKFNQPAEIEFSAQELNTRTVRLSNLKINDKQLEEKMNGNLPFVPKGFDFQKNLLSKIPNCVELYKDNLNTIQLNFNIIDKINLTFSLPYLTNLEITNNRLLSFPFNKVNENDEPLFPKLENLNLGFNLITQLPELSITSTNMPNLTTLLLPNNRIADINPYLPFLTSINYLDLSNNEIPSIPPIIANENSKIKTLELMGNPFKFPRYQTLQLGSSYVLEYLRNRIPK